MAFKSVSTAPYVPQTTNDSTGHNGAVGIYGTAINTHTHDPSDTVGNYGNSVPAWGSSNPLYGLHGPGGTTPGNDWSTAFNGTAAIPADPTEMAINPINNTTLTQGTPGATISASWGIHGELARIRGALALLKGSGKNWFDAVTLYSDPLTTTGDLLYRDGTNTTNRLAAGANGTMLQMAGGVPTWANVPGGFTDPTANPGDMIYRNGTNTPSALSIGPAGYILQSVNGLPTWASPSQVASSPATTSTLGTVEVDNNMAGTPVAITTAGYLTSLVGLTTANLSSTAGITSAQIASLAASKITSTLTKAQQFGATAYTDAAQTFSSTVTAQAFIPSAMTGATAAVRYLAATATGSPSTGTFQLGDVVPAQDGHIWICTVAGTPGSWVSVGGAGGGGGTVTSVALSMPATFTVTGSPITGAGTFSVAYASQAASQFLASPSGSSGVPTFRGIAAADLPIASASALGGIKVGSGLSIDINGVLSSTASGGTVTSVGLSLPNIFTVTGSPVTGAGTLTGALASQATGNQVFASPSGGGVPAFRALAAADVPAVNASAVTGILTAANMPIATASALGAVKTGAGVTIDGNGVIYAAGGLTVVTTSTTLTASSSQIQIVNAASLTVTLPAASAVKAGYCFIVKNGASGTSTTVGRSGTDTIDGTNGYAGLAAAFAAASFISDGSGAWYIL